MNIDYLKTLISEKYANKVEDFATAIGVSKVAVYAWLRGTSDAEDSRAFDIAEVLDLDEGQIDRLMGVPETIVSFRNKRNTETSSDTFIRGKELAESFFKIGDGSYAGKDTFPIAGSTNPANIAGLIRNLFGLANDEPVTFQNAFDSLKKHNVNVYFLPFLKLGIRLEENHEVAFTARQGEKFIIFLDTGRTGDEVTFDLCHELCHVVTRNDDVAGEDKERLCDSVAEELVYPSSFFKLKEDDLSILWSSKSSMLDICEVFQRLMTEFDWSPKGLALALKSQGRLKEASPQYERFMKLDAFISTHIRSLDKLFYSEYDPNNFEKLRNFFTNELPKNKQLFRPFIEIKNAACFGHLSYRKLSELLGINSGDADELIREWRKKDDALLFA